MKKLKHLLFLIISFVLAFSVARVFAPTSAENASGDMISSYPILNYVSLSTAGKPLTYDNLKAVGNSYYIFTSGSISINFKSLDYN